MESITITKWKNLNTKSHYQKYLKLKTKIINWAKKINLTKITYLMIVLLKNHMIILITIRLNYRWRTLYLVFNKMSFKSNS
jgi:hypothetical protein